MSVGKIRMLREDDLRHLINNLVINAETEGKTRDQLIDILRKHAS